MDLTLIERGNLRKSVNCLFTCGMSLTMNLVQITVIISVTVNAVHCHRRVVERVHLQLQNIATKTVRIQHEQQHER